MTFAYEGATEGNGLLKDGLQDVLTDLDVDTNSILSKVIVQANPYTEGAEAELVWNGKTTGTITISQTTTIYPILEYPVKLNALTYLRVSDGVNTRYCYADGTQAGDLPTGIASIVVTWHNTKPTIVISILSPVVLTLFDITGLTYKTIGLIEAQAENSDLSNFLQVYGPRELIIDNKYIDSQSSAQELADTLMARFQFLRSYLTGLLFAFTPQAQLYDRVKIIELNTGTDKELFLINKVQGVGQDIKSTTEGEVTDL